MNHWKPLRSPWPVISGALSALASVTSRVSLCFLGWVLLGLFGFLTFSQSASAQTLHLYPEEYLFKPPQSKVVGGSSGYTVSVEFGYRTVEPAQADYPVVQWFKNGVFYKEQPSALKAKNIDPTGTAHYDCYDPYATYTGPGGVLTAGSVAAAYTALGFPGGTKAILWTNTLVVSAAEAAADANAIYTAYIGTLGIPGLQSSAVQNGVWSPPAQIVLTPQQQPGQPPSRLTVNYSPESKTVTAGTQVTCDGDAKSNGNILMQNPLGVTVDPSGFVYIADTYNHSIRRVSIGGKGQTYAGLDGGIMDPSNPKLQQWMDYKESKITTITGTLVTSTSSTSNQYQLSSLQLPGDQTIGSNYRLRLVSGSLYINPTRTTLLPSTQNLYVTSVNNSTNRVTVDYKVYPPNLPPGTPPPTLTFDVYSNQRPKTLYAERSGNDTSGSWTVAQGDVFLGQLTKQDPDKYPFSLYDSTKASYRFTSFWDTASISDEPRFNTPEALVATDADDESLYVADTANDAIRRIYKNYRNPDAQDPDPTFVQTISAGSLHVLQAGVMGPLTYSNAGKFAAGQPTGAVVSAPRGIFFRGSMKGGSSNPPVLYVLDSIGVKKLTLNYLGQINGLAPGSCVMSVTYIGSPVQQVGVDGNRFYSPRGLVVTEETTEEVSKVNGSKCSVIYVADTISHVIRKLRLKSTNPTDPHLSEDAAGPSEWTSEIVAGGVGSQADALDAQGNPLYADGKSGYYAPATVPDCRIVGGTCLTLATPYSSGAVAVNDLLWINGGSYKVSRVQSGSLFTVGTLTSASVSVGSLVTVTLTSPNTGRTTSARENASRLSYPAGLTMDDKRDLYFTEMGSHNVRRVRFDRSNFGVSAYVETVAGAAGQGPSDGTKGEGTGLKASFNFPVSIAYDSSRNQKSFLVADSANHSVRRISSVVQTYNVKGAGIKGQYTISNLDNLAGLAPLMTVAHSSVPMGAYITAINYTTRVITLNLPLLDTLSSTDTFVVSQDVFDSRTALGVVKMSGNRDFWSESTEYFYQWQKFGVSVPLTRYNKRFIGGTSPHLTMLDVQTGDSGIYQLKIYNQYYSSALTSAASLYVPTSDSTKFTEYSLKPLSSTGEVTSVLRSDVGDVNFTLKASISPADAVTYGWQVLLPDVDGARVWVKLYDTARTNFFSTLSDPKNIVDDAGVAVANTPKISSMVTALQKLMGTDGIGGVTLEGTATSTLKVTGFQKSLIAAKTLPLPTAKFRMYAIQKNDSTVIIGQPQSVDGFDVSALAVPLVTAGTYSYQVDGGTMLSVVYNQVRLLTANAGSVTLSAGDSVVNVIPSAIDTTLQNFQTWSQWISSDKPQATAQRTETVLSTQAGNAPPLSVSANSSMFYWVRYYTADGDPTVAGTNVVGKAVDGSEVRIFPYSATGVGGVDYRNPDDGKLYGVKVIYVNAYDALASGAPSFSLDATVDNGKTPPQYEWSYLKWGETNPSSWQTISTGTVSSGSLSYMQTTSGTLGVGSKNESAFYASLNMTLLSTTASAAGPYVDLSGFYRLKATVNSGTGSADKYQYWLVAARQVPSVNSYGTVSTEADPYKKTVNIAGRSGTASMAVDLLLPLPDQIPMGDIYGGTLAYAKGIVDAATRTLPESDDFSGQLKFQWTKDKQVLVNSGKLPMVIDGGTITVNGGTLSLQNIGEKQIGTYALTVSNSCGTSPTLGPINSTGAKGWMIVFDGEPYLAGAPSAKSTGGLTLTDATGGAVLQRVAQGQMVALEVPVKSSYPLKYYWSFMAPGAPWKLLPSPTANVDSKYLIRSAALTDAGTYAVRFTYSSGTTVKSVSGGSVSLVVEPLPDPAVPKLTAIGTSVVAAGNARTVFAGGTVTLSATSLKSGTSFLSGGSTRFFTFQWKKDGIRIVGETNETLTVTNLSRSQAGAYAVDVTGVAGVKTSSALTLGVVSATTTEALYPVTFKDLGDVKYFMTPTLKSGSLAAGSMVFLTGMSPAAQTLLGWRVWDSAGTGWDLPARGAQFVMPSSPVIISPILGRATIGQYSGFLSLEMPWNENLEWDIYPLLAMDSSQRASYTTAPSASQVRGFFKASVNSFGTVSGTIIIEGKTYPFTTTLALSSDGSYSGAIRIQAMLADRTPWLLTGSMTFNMGLRKTSTLTKGSSTVLVSGGSAGLMESMDVKGYGIPEGTVITRVIDKNTVALSSEATVSSGTLNKAGTVPVTFGMDTAALDNVMHVRLDDVVLELTPPVMKSGRPLYAVAACNTGLFSSLSKAVTAATGVSPSKMVKYTAAVYRYRAPDPSPVFGRGGILSVNISNIGNATVSGVLPNGAKLTFSGYGGRSCYVQDDQKDDPLAPFSPVLAPSDTYGWIDSSIPAVSAMQEALERHTSSISIPLWSTSPTGDVPQEPLFGALLLSGSSAYGSLGVLNTSAQVSGAAASGTIAMSSEYTHNYVLGAIFDPTQDPNTSKPNPFTSTALMSLWSLAPDPTATAYEFVRPTSNITLGTLNTTGMATLGYKGNLFSPTVTNGSISSFPAPVLDAVATSPTLGILSGSYIESTGRYVLRDPLTGLLSGPDWASIDSRITILRESLSVRFWAVTLQGEPMGKAILGGNYSYGSTGGAAGFLIRGTKAETLKNVLGNGYQAPSQIRKPFTYRIEGFNLNAFEPN